jgi:succinate dehydrogenase / fumarate reductase cytochrome b subunit
MSSVPRAFFWRRVHSLVGLALVLFLCEHLLTNSQAALFVGDDGKGFIHGVNFIHSLPYLPVIEILILLVPFIIHILWGIKYLRTSKLNSSPTDGSKPSLGSYARNQLYTWQRITSWLLIIGISAHVLQMRFLRYPEHTSQGGVQTYRVHVSDDDGLRPVAKRVNARVEEGEQLTITSQDIGTSILFTVRDVMKDPFMMAAYTLLVLLAVFHAFNGLWTFFITWGVNLTPTSQNLFRRVTLSLTLLMGFLGLVSIYGTYWINLRH